MSAGRRAPTKRDRARDYEGRDHAVGVFAFDASADFDTVSEYVSALLHAFCPRDGLVVRAARGSKREVLEARFGATSAVRASQLERGGSVELSSKGVFDPGAGRCTEPLFWISSRPRAEIADDEVAIEIGFAIPRPRARAAEAAIAHALDTFAEASVELAGCVSAVVTSQGPALSLARSTLAYEALFARVNPKTDASWLKTHVRSPGWRVLVPRPVAKPLATTSPPPPGVTVERVRSGLLARLGGQTPHVMASSAAMERWLRPLLS